MVLGILISSATDAAQNAGAEFSFRLYKNILKSHSSKNFVFAPYALRTALGMTALGARGRTQRQLGRAPDPWVSKKEPSYKLYLANRLWVQMGFSLLDGYMVASDKNFGVRPWMVDFTKAPDFLTDRVNRWVAERTLSKVKSMVTENLVDSSMRMILTSAAYFKGDWVYPFNPLENQKEKFINDSGKKTTTEFIHKRGSFNYLSTEGNQIIELPYLDGELALVIILPSAEDGLLDLERSLKIEKVDQWLSVVAPKDLRISLPKFEFQSDFELKESFNAMGISDAFSPEAADFSGMTGRKDLYLSTWVHKAFIGLGESGTEAASSSLGRASRSLASVSSLAQSSNEETFKANHPFIFMVRHRSTGSILFFGHFVDVKSTAENEAKTNLF